MFEIVIVADENDADYVTEISKIEQSELDLLMPIIEAIKEKHGEWPYIDFDTAEIKEIYPDLTIEQIEQFNNFIPSGAYGIHDIIRIEYYPVPEKIRLL